MNLNYLKKSIYKNKEIILYLFFGGLTFFISIGTYAVLNVMMGINELISNFISWVIAVLFAFFTNRIWVFNSHTSGFVEFIKQMWDFIFGRIITLIIEELILFVFITKMHCISMAVKIIAQIIVIILNYIISKVIVFKDK